VVLSHEISKKKRYDEKMTDSSLMQSDNLYHALNSVIKVYFLTYNKVLDRRLVQVSQEFRNFTRFYGD
jgi:hypothetical protein